MHPYNEAGAGGDEWSIGPSVLLERKPDVFAGKTFTEVIADWIKKLHCSMPTSVTGYVVSGLLFVMYTYVVGWFLQARPRLESAPVSNFDTYKG